MGAKIKVTSAMLIFGSMGLFVRSINLPSGEIAMVRGVIGVLSLLLISIALRKYISKTAILKNGLLLIASGIALCADWVFLFEAYKHTTIAVATLSYYLAPIFVVAASPFVLREKITMVKVVCIAASLVGMVFISGIFTNPSQGTHDFLGIGFGIAAAVSYASLTLLNKFVKGLSSMEATIAQLGIASVFLLPYTLLTEDFIGLTIGCQAIELLIILGVVHTGFAFWLYFSSIQALKAQTVAGFSYIDPITAILLSALLLNEKMGLMQILGTIFVLGSTFFSERFRNYFDRKNTLANPCKHDV